MPATYPADRSHAQEGDKFGLKRFHDTLPTYRFPPVKALAARRLGGSLLVKTNEITGPTTSEIHQMS